jgi:hypothetical protein
MPSFNDQPIDLHPSNPACVRSSTLNLMSAGWNSTTAEQSENHALTRIRASVEAVQRLQLGATSMRYLGGGSTRLTTGLHHSRIDGGIISHRTRTMHSSRDTLVTKSTAARSHRSPSRDQIRPMSRLRNLDNYRTSRKPRVRIYSLRSSALTVLAAAAVTS